MGRMDDLVNEALFKPDDRLVRALEKKLTAVELDLLERWLQEERLEAANREWLKHKDRIPPGY